jgi:hypothetical protein
MNKGNHKLCNVKFLCLVLSFAIVSCDIFTTRTPEEPDTDRTGYEPPTSPSVVLSNFSNSINEMNSENFISCLSDTAQGYPEYKFIASAEATAQFPGMFTYWDRLSEQKSFNSIIASIEENNRPTIEFNKSIYEFEVLISDSAVFYSEYELSIPFKEQTETIVYKGMIELTMMPNRSQKWAIVRWVDFSLYNDTTNRTWSILKGEFGI